MTDETFRMRPIYDLLLYGTPAVPIGLYQLHLATAEQLCRLHYSMGSIKAIKARLKTLVDNGLIQFDRAPTKLSKSPYYYTLANAGMEYLARLGFDMNESWREKKEIGKHALFLDHTLEVNDLLVSAALLGQQDPQYHLSSFRHEREMKCRPLRVKWKDNAHTASFSIIPDAFLDFQSTGTNLHLRMLLEHDRGTEGPQFFRKRIRAYIGLYKTENYKSYFNINKLTVAFTTFAGEHRLKQIRTWTEAELASTQEPWEVGTIFLFTATSRLDVPPQLWLQPRWQLAYADRTQQYPLLNA